MRQLLGIAAAAAVVLALPSPATAEDEPTCQGQVATIVGTPYADTLYGTPGPDVVWLGGTAYETATFDDDNDRFWGLGGDDLICQGGRGGVVVDAGAGDDEVHLDGTLRDLQYSSAAGGEGNDLLVAPPLQQQGSSLSGDAGDDELVSTGGSDSLTGGVGDDTIRGGDGADHVYEGPGNDDIDGGSGGPARDWVHYSGGSEALRSGDRVAAPIVLDVAAGRVVSGPDVDTVSAVECFVGTSQGDVMSGTEGPDCLYGVGEGTDRITGLGGADEITFSSGTADSGAGDDTVLTEYLYVEEDDESPLEPIRTETAVRAGPGDDHVYARGFRVVVEGGPGLDVLDLTGSILGDGYRTGDVGFRIDVPRRQVTAPDQAFQSTTTFSGIERHEGSSFPDVFQGGPGEDHFSGGRGDDRAKGSSGDDVLLGGPGADRLEAGMGRDLVLGQSGRPDLADGGPGRDRCSAERREECEVRA